MSETSGAWLDDGARDLEDEYSSERMLLHIYGGEENMKNLVILTHEQTYEHQKGKLLDYLARTDLDERTRENSQKDLAVLETWRENGFK
jgi:hypothetical protein